MQQYLNYTKPIRESSGTYKFIHPLLAYRIAPASEEAEFRLLKNNILELVDKKKNTSTLQDFALYFNELDRGRWIGINEDQTFSPASLLKAAIMIAYYKESEHNPQLLTQKLLFSQAVRDHILLPARLS
jgi:beta-lactamase class A